VPARVRFLPSGREVTVAEGATLLEATLAAGLPLASSCRGVGSCGWCRVRVLEGAAGLSSSSEAERRLLAKLGAAADERIACLARVQQGEVAITTGYW